MKEDERQKRHEQEAFDSSGVMLQYMIGVPTLDQLVETVDKARLLKSNIHNRVSTFGQKSSRCWRRLQNACTPDDASPPWFRPGDDPT
jgi:hypothetical protein